MARILAVDDDALVRRCIQRILRRQGHEVVEASHGAQALRLVQDRSFDIALVDYQLPQMDGIEVLQKLREVQPACLRMLNAASGVARPAAIGFKSDEIRRVITIAAPPGA